MWNKHKGDAIAVEIGAAKMAYMVVGSAGTPRAAIEPDELEYRVSETAKKLALNDDAKQVNSIAIHMTKICGLCSRYYRTLSRPLTCTPDLCECL